MTNSARSHLLHSKLIVVKVGSSSLVDASGNLSLQKFKKISEEIAFVTKKMKKKVILVSSGAIVAGRKRLKKKDGFNTIVEKQAAAAIGQSLLMKKYEKHFSAFGLIPAQVLLTKDALDNRQRRENSKNTIDQIIKFGAVPVINENDTVSADEIKFGDNDTLSALVADLVNAGLLIILSDVEGFIKNGKVVSVINKITKGIEDAAGRTNSKFGTGGMLTKIRAAKIATSSGVKVVIAKSSKKNIIPRILNGENTGTLFSVK